MKRIGLVVILVAVLGGSLLAQDAITVYSEGNVGIGDPPAHTEKLTVNGRISDKSGLVMPVGAILPFGGGTAPAGWLLCEGAPVSRATYADLFAVIGTAFGSGNGSSTFNVPDLRGVFLRGADGGTGRDPDAAKRCDLASAQTCTADYTTDYLTVASVTDFPNDTPIILTTTSALPAPLVGNTIYYVVQLDAGSLRFKVSITQGGAAVDLTANGSGTNSVYKKVGDVVGSYQEDAFQDHQHDHYGITARKDCSSGSTMAKNFVMRDVTSGGHTVPSANNSKTTRVLSGEGGSPRTTSETVPENVYVKFIIKY